MVRRRARNSKPAAAALAVVPTNLLEEQYFASPKRKDCKVDNSASKQEETALKTKSSSHSPKTKTERTIGVPLATRSQTRTIENFFKAKTAKENHKKSVLDNAADETIQTLPPPPDLHIVSAFSVGFEQVQLHPELIFEVSDDDEENCDTEISDEATSSGANEPIPEVDFAVHQTVSLDGSYSSRSSTNATENIFLQEPVLTLNVDKTPNQASSIKINKTIEVEPVFSSPPTLGAAALHGRFNQIVSLNGSVNDFGSPTKRCGLLPPHINNQLNGCYLLLPENDNSSCDSGVGLIGSIDNNNSNKSDTSLLTTSPYVCGDIEAQLTPNQIGTRRRKPATPHRILCPSPTKAPSPRAIVHTNNGRITSPSAAARKKEQILSPRKSPRHFPIVATVASKSRRRLNPQHQAQQQQQQQLQKDKAPYLKEIITKTVAQQHGYEHQNGSLSNDAETLQAHDELENSQETTASNRTKSTKQQANVNVKSSKNAIKQSNNNHFLPPKTNGGVNQKQQLKQQATTLQPLAMTTTNTGNRELTEFFPVRRSVRKTKTAVKEEMMRTLEQAVLEERAEGLKVAHFEGKGRGVVAERRFQRNEFVVEYIGDLISMTEAMEREKRYALDENAGCYMYYFKHKNQQYCIDATLDTGKLGRLVNHSRNGNLITKVVVVKQRPHLVLLAKDDILAGEELTYDYGDRSKESLMHHPWLAF